MYDKYLKYHADKTLEFCSSIPDHEFVLVIPAYNEGEEFIQNLVTLTANAHKIFIIIIINYPEKSNPTSSNILFKKLCNLGFSRTLSSQISLVSLNTSTLALCGPFELPLKQGVGKARKIGADWALDLMSKNKISTPIIFSTDADALLPKNYFIIGQENLCQESAALVYNFKHKKPECPLLSQAITLYEQRLNHYVAGLKYAGSPYAFHTIGSTIAIKSQSYAEVRGFPSRPAGEDFYLLNKLRKVGIIKSLQTDPIILSARVSNRVPFGTGPALSAILHNNKNILDIITNTRIFYHPQVFDNLKNFLNLCESRIKNNSLSYEDMPHKNIFEKLSKYHNLSHNLSTRACSHDRLEAFHCWFDAFMTLKFIHLLRDQQLPMCSLSELEKLGYHYKV